MTDEGLSPREQKLAELFADRKCEVCEENQPIAVCALPGFPVSLATCQRCLTEDVLPMFCLEVTLCDDEQSPDHEVGRTLTLEETIQKHGAAKVKSIGAPWFLAMKVWLPGRGAVVIGELIDEYGRNHNAP